MKQEANCLLFFLYPKSYAPLGMGATQFPREPACEVCFCVGGELQWSGPTTNPAVLLTVS